MGTRLGDVSAMLEMLPPFALRVAATLRISDHMADGVTTVAGLAAATGTDRDALGRLLRYLACLGVYREDRPGEFSATAAGRLLAARHPAGLCRWLDLDGAGGRMDLALGGLLHAVRTGRPGYDEVFGRPFWDDLSTDTELADSFDALMAMKSARVAAELAAHVDLPAEGRLVDVGGGSGVALAAVLRAHPGWRGAVLERPETAARAVDALADAGLAGRCEVVAGSFLDQVPAGAEAYLLFDILHNWDDGTALDILRRCAGACPPGGRLLIVEQAPLGPDDRAGAAMDLKMLTLFGGRQRTADELRDLAARAGLATAAASVLPCGFSVVECVAPVPATSAPGPVTG